MRKLVKERGIGWVIVHLMKVKRIHPNINANTVAADPAVLGEKEAPDQGRQYQIEDQGRVQQSHPLLLPFVNIQIHRLVDLGSHGLGPQNARDTDHGPRGDSPQGRDLGLL